jgi:hypothetical protein
LWRATTAAFEEINPPELAILTEVCRAMDHLAP